MRVPEQSMAAAAARIGSAVLAAIALCAGCAAPPPVEVTYDQSEDLSRFRTWDWIEGDAVFVYTPFDAVGIEQQLSALVEGALRSRGLERAPGGAELRVAALLVGTRHVESFRRARAMQTLYSYHDIGGYEVEGEDTERRPVDRCRLAIYVTGSRQEKMIWQAVSNRKHTGGCAPHLEAAVASLLESFPPASPTAER
jgi:Domain of unknown function (DUF4136)